MSPLMTCLRLVISVIAAVYIASLVTREYSWVDRIWSIVPVVYVCVFAGAAGFTDVRLDVMLALVALWGARLTYNFARKGGYARGGEDYRWGVLRGRMTPRQFHWFNLGFITIYQNVLLLLICLPAFTAYQNRTPFGLLDALATALFLAFLAGETVADQQQWEFQQWKKSEVDAGRPASPRFVQTGLFRYSRHPNFFFEQAQWWTLFLFGVAAAGSVLQWTVIGAFLLSLLFIGSTRFTESISRSRYPEYARYQETTSAVVPWPRPRLRRQASGQSP